MLMANSLLNPFFIPTATSPISQGGELMKRDGAWRA
jgi:hypothetical protein